jgi:hypothetical protein
MEKFAAVTGLGEPQGDSTPAAQPPISPDTIERIVGNSDFFLAHYLLPITSYVLDVARLKKVSSHVVVGIGADSGGQLANDTALALAEDLRVPPVTFPGGHTGYFEHPDAFAAKLREVLQTS